MNRNPGDLVQKLRRDHIRYEKNCNEVERIKELSREIEREENEN